MFAAPHFGVPHFAPAHWGPYQEEATQEVKRPFGGSVLIGQTEQEPRDLLLEENNKALILLLAT